MSILLKKSTLFVITFCLVLSLLLSGCTLWRGTPAGDVKLISSGKQYAPFKNFVCSRRKDGPYADGMRKQPRDIVDELDVVSVSDDVQIVITGKTVRLPCYTLYDKQYKIIYDSQEEFVMPEEPGTYILTVGVTWGTEEVYESYQCFFLMEKE